MWNVCKVHKCFSTPAMKWLIAIISLGVKYDFFQLNEHERWFNTFQTILSIKRTTNVIFWSAGVHLKCFQKSTMIIVSDAWLSIR